MQCSNCASSLPAGSKFCLKCGERVPTQSAARTAEPLVEAVLACSRCGTPLPEEAEFCLKCGKPVSGPAKPQNVVEVLPPAVPPPAARSRRRKVLLWTLFATILIGLFVWLILDDSPFAQGFQEILGWKHDQVVLETPFTVGPHTFRYYKFSLPEGSVNVAVIGQFTASADAAARNRKDGQQNSGKSAAPDNDIQALVLTEAAFTVWQNGYVTSSVFESGQIAQGSINAEIPAGAGIYYLVFNNKFSAATAKSVHATVLLRYKSWLPDWLRRIQGRFSNWSTTVDGSTEP